jgi:hypothetical protein
MSGRWETPTRLDSRRPVKEGVMRDVVMDHPRMVDVAEQVRLRPHEDFLSLWIQDTRGSHWRALLRYLSTGAWPAQISDPVGTREVPGGDAEVEAIVSRIGAGEIVHMLRIWPGDYVVISHFFTRGTIELGVLARPLRDPGALFLLVRFMADVAVAVGKDVKLTYETAAGADAEALVVATAAGEVHLGDR